MLVKGLGLGGAERLLVDQITHGPPCPVTYEVAYVRADKTHFVARLEAAGVAVTLLGVGGGARWWPIDLALHLRHTRPAVVHSHSPLLAAVARVLVALGAAGRGGVHVYTEHNRWSAYRWPTRVANAATMALDRVAWTVSEEAHGSVWPGWLRQRVIPLRHGIDLVATRLASVAEPDPAPSPAPPDAFTFVHVANRRREKAHEVLLDAFALATELDSDLRLWLVGQRLDDDDLRARIEVHPARERIQVLGYRSDAPALIARADALVLSSDHEGLPVVVMEAFALGRPVVSTAVGGVPEAVRHEREGLLVPARDPTALATAMVDLHRDPDRYHRLAAGAALRAERFDARRANEVQEQAYLRLARR